MQLPIWKGIVSVHQMQMLSMQPELLPTWENICIERIDYLPTIWQLSSPSWTCADVGMKEEDVIEVPPVLPMSEVLVSSTRDWKRWTRLPSLKTLGDLVESSWQPTKWVICKCLLLRFVMREGEWCDLRKVFPSALRQQWDWRIGELQWIISLVPPHFHFYLHLLRHPCTSIYICLPLLPCYALFFSHQTTVYMSSFCSLECRFLFGPSQIFSNGKKRFPPADRYHFFFIIIILAFFSFYISSPPLIFYLHHRSLLPTVQFSNVCRFLFLGLAASTTVPLLLHTWEDLGQQGVRGRMDLSWVTWDTRREDFDGLPVLLSSLSTF